MIVLDTTVLVYALGAGHPFRDPCRQLIQAIADGTIEATTTVEVVQEFVHARARRHGRIDASRRGRDYADLLAPLLTVSAAELRDGLALYERNDALGASDAVLAATAMAVGGALVSADTAFAAVPGLDHVVPDTAGMAALLPA